MPVVNHVLTKLDGAVSAPTIIPNASTRLFDEGYITGVRTEVLPAAVVAWAHS